MSSGAVMPFRASSRPPRLSAVVCYELVKTALTGMVFSPSFLSPAICVSPRPALLPACRVVRRGGMISPFSLLACSVMSSWPWRCRLIRGDLPCVCLLVLAPSAAARFSSRSSLSLLACPPRLLVSWGGEVGVVVIRLSCSYRFPGRLRLRLAS